MSVCAHVSKVSKDYSPYGYSIMESGAGGSFTTAAGPAGPAGGASLALMDDASAWLEAAYLFSGGGYAAAGDDAANNWTVALAAIDAAGAGVNLAVWSSWDGAAPVSLAGSVLTALDVGPAEIPAGSFLGFQVVRLGTPANDLQIDIMVRYRRKA